MPLKVMWYRAGDRAGASEQEVVLPGTQPIKVGRLQSNDIVLNDGGVSRTHATLSFDGTRVVVTDNDSQNGTFIDRTRVRSSPWSAGQMLAIGPYVLEFEIVAEKRSAAATVDEKAGATVVIATPPPLAAPRTPAAAGRAAGGGADASPAAGAGAFPVPCSSIRWCR